MINFQIQTHSCSLEQTTTIFYDQHIKKFSIHFKGGRPLVYIELWRIPTNTSMHTSALIKKDFSYKRSLTHKVSITPKGSNSFIIKSLLFIRIIMHFAGLFKSKQPNYSKLSIFKQKTKSYMFKCLFFKLLDFSRN